MLKQNYSINENKINFMLDELEADRAKIFAEIKTSNSSDVTKENKLRNLEEIQKKLMKYKKLLTKEKETI
jgi:Mg2+ and Co2+ transporter CorA